jgi:hypothetical protein
MSRRRLLVGLLVLGVVALWLFGMAVYMGAFDSTWYRVRGTVVEVNEVPGDEGFVSACITGTEDAGTEGANVEWDDPECETFPANDAPKVGQCVVIQSRPHNVAAFRPDEGCQP